MTHYKGILNLKGYIWTRSIYREYLQERDYIAGYIRISGIPIVHTIWTEVRIMVSSIDLI